MSETLYGRLGGAPAIEAAVALFYQKVLDDPALAPFFERVNVKAQRIQRQRFMTTAFAGPDLYRGRDMAEALLEWSRFGPGVASAPVLG